MISLAMPTYNGEKYLREQLDSIYSQTMVPDEVIVVDDCSTDRTVHILHEYSERYGLKYYINEQNLGYNKNFERAISLCSGEYIALCDQDDIWLPTKIEKCYNKLKSFDDNAPSLVSCFSSTSKDVLSIINEDGLRICADGNWKHNLSLYTSQGCTLMFNRALAKYITCIPSGVMYDAYIGFVASLIGNRHYIGEILMYYRIHNSNSFGSSSPKLKDRIKNNLLRTIPNWFTLERYKILSLVREQFSAIIEDEKKLYLDRILRLYEVGKLKRIVLFNSIKEIPIFKKIVTSILLLIKWMFMIDDKY